MPFWKDLMQKSPAIQKFYLKFRSKKSIIYINDDTLINNFYEILAHEYAFDEIFKKIGINPKINLTLDEVKRINEWLNNNSERNPKVELIRQFENFRAISKDPKKFEDQIKYTTKLFELIIDAFNISKECDLKFLDYKENLNYLKNSQDFSLRLQNFKRDNLIHPLRVFLLGCYIINADKNFWIDRTMESIKKDLFPTSNILFGPIYLKLGITNNDFRLKLVFLMWMVASLCHDIGRSIEDANETIKDVTIAYGSLPKFRWGCINISSGTKKIYELKLSSLIITPDEIGERKKRALFAFLEWVYPDEKKYRYIEKIMKDKYEKLDHGVISAILSTDYEYLKYLEEENAFIEILKNPVRFLCYSLIHYSFISISLHNNQRYFFTSPLTQLFIAVDTLQEWNRVTKIGDVERKIYPCDRIELKFDDLKGSKGKIIEAIIPYEEPTDDYIKEIFNRRKTDHEDLVKELTKSQEEKMFYNFFDKGVELRIGYLEAKSKEILKLKICGFCGRITHINEKGANKDMNNLICSNPECESHERI